MTTSAICTMISSSVSVAALVDVHSAKCSRHFSPTHFHYHHHPRHPSPFQLTSREKELRDLSDELTEYRAKASRDLTSTTGGSSGRLALGGVSEDFDFSQVRGVNLLLNKKQQVILSQVG